MLICRLATATSLLLLLTACGSKGGSSNAAPAGGPGNNGSCTSKSTCSEQVENDETFGQTCTAFGGIWSASACDQSKYASKCEQESKVSINDGPMHTIHTINYFPKDSKTSCFGKSSPLGK